MAKSKTNFMFVDLASLIDQKEIDCMAAAEGLTDMYGYKLDIPAGDLPAFVANTTAALESTKDSAGNVVGLPIDGRNHDHGDAAGWITGVRQDGPIVKASIRWTPLGEKLVKDDTMRFFSPSLDLNEKVIVGGSLTNYPASRTKKHKMLLRPVELSEQLQTMSPEEAAGMMEKIMTFFKDLLGMGEMEPEEPEEPANPETPPAPPAGMQTAAIMAQLAANPTAEFTQMIEQRATALADAKIAESARKAHVSELCAKLTGGTQERPTGLPVQSAELSALLLSLNDDQRAKAEMLFSQIHASGVVEFSERGSSRTQVGNKILPPEMAAQLSKYLASNPKNTVEKFFSINAVDLGSMADYNLSDFVQKEN